MFLSSWASQFALFLPTLPSLSFYRQSSNPETNHVPRALSYSSTRGLWERSCPKLLEVLWYTLKFQFRFQLLKKVPELASSSTLLLSVAADIIITLSSSWSPRNIIKAKGCHVNHFSSPTPASPDSSFISLEKGNKAASDGSHQRIMELPIFFSPAFSI